jgi:DNA-binding response OmpR family regulator
MWSFFKNEIHQLKHWISRSIHPAENEEASDDQLIALNKVLCVDDDIDFCHYIQRLARSLNIQVETVFTIEAAKRQIEKTPNFQAFIIDGHLPDGSGFELVAWIREKKGLSDPIAFISRIYQDAASFRLLKEKLKVNYVLEKPLRPLEIKNLLLQLCQLEPSISKIETDIPEQLLASLKETYQKSIIDKVERLEQLVLTVQREPSSNHLKALKTEIHKIAGSSGSYGYPVVSEICKNLEAEINDKIKGLETEPVQAEWLSSLDEIFTQIKLHFQMHASTSLSHWKPTQDDLSIIYLVDQDQKFSDDLNHSESSLLFQIVTESSPEKALEQLKSDFYPKILIVNAYYTSSITGFELIKAFYQHNDPLNSLVAVLVDAQSVADQVEVLSKGFTFILTKPLTARALFALFDQLPSGLVTNTYQILVIDDDQDICHYMIHLLSQPSIHVVAISDPEEVESYLLKNKPDLILLDMNLNDNQGNSLLNLLRQRDHYQEQILGMIALTSSSEFIQKCYDTSIEDLIFKPFEGHMIQNKVTYLLKKRPYSRSLSSHDSFPLIDQTFSLTRFLNHIQSSQAELNSVTALALIHMDGIDNPKILQQAAHTFDYLYKRYEWASYLGDHTFGVVFQGIDFSLLKYLLHAFLKQLHENLQCKFPNEKHLKLSCGLAAKQVKSPSFSHLKQEADQALSQAKAKQEAWISLETYPPDYFPDFLKIVLIISEKERELKQLKEIFNQKTYEVITYSKLNEEIKQQLPEHSFSHCPLFILIGELAETQGAFLLKMLVKESRLQIPILHFKKLLSIKHLEDLLKQLNYFDQPFHLMITIEEFPVE